MGCRRTAPAGCDEGGCGLSGTPARANAHTTDGVPADRSPRLRRVAGVAGIGDAGTLTFPIVVAAQTQAELLLDYRVLHTGYPTLRFRGGKDAEIEIGYAESLFDRAETGAKGHRDSVAGKLFVGYADRIVADGGAGRSYTPLWWRTWRYGPAAGGCRSGAARHRRP